MNFPDQDRNDKQSMYALSRGIIRGSVFSLQVRVLKVTGIVAKLSD